MDITALREYDSKDAEKTIVLRAFFRIILLLPKGVLAESGFMTRFSKLLRALLKTVLRLPFALNFSILMGTFVTLTLFRDSLENHIEKKNNKQICKLE
ncbi:hypothetical protein SAMN05216339_105143 [Nitrosomonas eutropha]|uniref:Uncharacterized protein n=1 Tax=Nitrosomonas eutropha TaxID=916 RepID=A0A1I7HPS6_9PROT|nr:hypothetical protein [Nitrosomonas eutropha]SFU62629.1 hypothetical protein SAMN05216339_105143 [Nitrosomonas eutropha]